MFLTNCSGVKKLSQETKDKIGKALKGRPRPDMIGNKYNIWGHYD